MSKEIFFCGLHRYKTIDKHTFCIHLIDDHDTEHGKHQLAGTKRFTVSNPIFNDGKWSYGEPKIDLGVFRYLPIFHSKDCDEKVSLWGMTNPNSSTT